MPKNTPYAPIRVKLAGLDNRHDPSDVGAHAVIAANVDFLDNGDYRRRKGRTATAVTGAAMHSVWGSRDETFGYVADGDQLYYLDSNLSPALVGTLPSSSAAVFVEANEVVACGQQGGIRFLSAGSFITFALPPQLDGETQRKVLMANVTGVNCLAFHNGILYAGTDEGVFYSDAYNIGVRDYRESFIPTPFPVIRMGDVLDGLWVCGTTRSAFFAGAGPDEFAYMDHPDIGVTAMAETTLDEWGGTSDAKAWAALCTEGVFILAPGGSAKEVTGNAYAPPAAAPGPAIVRHINGARQLLAGFTYSAEGDSYTDKPMTVDTLELEV